MSNNNVLKEATKRFSVSKDAVISALDDGRSVVKQITKRTSRTVNDLLDETVHQIKRYPLGSIVVALGVGALVGVVLGRTARR